MRQSDYDDPRPEIEKLVFSNGFDVVGFSSPSNGDAGKQLDKFIAKGFHGEMDWMARTLDRRRTPASLWPEVRSIIVVGINYAPVEVPRETLECKDQGYVSVYARGSDYHDVMKKRLRFIARRISENWNCDVKLFVDTAPVLEKPLAQNAGIGWLGKHTNLVSQTFGSWLFLGEIFTTLDIPMISSHLDKCGTCRACIDVCPTNAFPEPYKLDARRCISYLTIEHKGHIAREFRVAMGNRIYGCDDCLAVCPWNKFAKQTPHVEFYSGHQFVQPLLRDLALLDELTFRKKFSGSPIKRIGRDRFVRNVLIAIGNSGDKELIKIVESLLDDSSSLVRAMAVWALSKLLDRKAFLILRQKFYPTEQDVDVVAEWNGEN
tara:strand:+ start:235 stop:1362 length:1128 start_codon:yes stop_codon:yes gene_type:complete